MKERWYNSAEIESSTDAIRLLYKLQLIDIFVYEALIAKVLDHAAD